MEKEIPEHFYLYKTFLEKWVKPGEPPSPT